MIYIVDHVDLNVSSSEPSILMKCAHDNFVRCTSDFFFEQMCLIYLVLLQQAKSVPEVLRPLYESPKILAQKMTAAVCVTVHSHCC